MNEDIISNQEETNNEKLLTGTSDEVKRSLHTIPVIHEHLQIDKELIETGKVKISKTVHEHEETVDIPLMSEEVSVERVPFNEYLQDTTPSVRYEGETMIIPIIKEILFVEKRMMLVEEVRVTKKQNQTTETQQVTLRREEVNITRE